MNKSMNSKYRLMENNGLYKIEEYKSVGFFRKRYEWVQRTKTLVTGGHAYQVPVYYKNRDEALQALKELRLSEARQFGEWEEVKV